MRRSAVQSCQWSAEGEFLAFPFLVGPQVVETSARGHRPMRKQFERFGTAVAWLQVASRGSRSSLFFSRLPRLHTLSVASLQISMIMSRKGKSVTFT